MQVADIAADERLPNYEVFRAPRGWYAALLRSSGAEDSAFRQSRLRALLEGVRASTMELLCLGES